MRLLSADYLLQARFSEEPAQETKADAKSIYKATKDNEKLIAEMARQLSISYCPSSDPSSRVVHPDYFPFSTIPFQISRAEYRDLETKGLYLQELLLKASEDKELINHIFRQTRKADKFVGRLLDIYNEVYEETRKQPIRCSIIRNDFMKDGPDGNWSLVEFNASSPGCGTTSDRIQRFSYFLSGILFKQQYKKANIKFQPQKQEYSKSLDAIIEAWKAYSNPDAIILFVWEGVQENIYDEMDIQMHFTCKGIKVVRENLSVLNDRIKLKQGKLFFERDEVGLVFYRAGFLPKHYLSENEWNTRKTIELSLAVKVPTIGMQLVNFKRAQTDLCTHELLVKYLGQEKANALKPHFVQCWDFDTESLQEDIIRQVIGHEEDYVLKPNLQGGGNNFFNKQIVTILQKSSPEERKKYTLMKMMRKSSQKSVMFTWKGIKLTEVITQIGFFGTILAINGDVKLNIAGGNLIKSKDQFSGNVDILYGSEVQDAFIFKQDRE